MIRVFQVLLYTIALYQQSIYNTYIALKREVKAMSTGSVFENNRTQAVRLPADSRFPEDVKRVNVRIVGVDRVLSPLNKSWDSFFLSEETVTDDFMTERATQYQAERESLAPQQACTDGALDD